MDMSEELIRAAKSVSKRSYSPYSHFAVGAAVLTESDGMYTGTNIENASYGATICAERVAVFNAITAGAKRIAAIAVYSETALPYPCGMCLQVLSEFAGGDAPVYLVSETERVDLTLKDLLPHPFNKQ